MYRLTPEDEKKRDKVIEVFNNTVIDILIACEHLDPENDKIINIKNMVNAALYTFVGDIIDRCTPKLLDYGEHIIKKDTAFFMNPENKFDKYVKKDGNQNNMYSYFAFIQNRFPKLSPEQQADMWVKIQKLLSCAIMYNKLVNAK
jgi:hypothetical protein